MSEVTGVGAYNTAAYLRVASLGIALYDYLETLPSVSRYYKSHISTRRLTVSPVLFVLIRATSISVLVVSNVGFFYSNFTQESCRRYFLIPPIFKVLQATVSQLILGVRAYNLSRRSRGMGWLLVSIFVAATILEWVSSLYRRTPKFDPNYGNCRATFQVFHLGAWTYYAIAIAYDLSTTILSIHFIRAYRASSPNSTMSKIIRIMLYDGIWYFVALTAVNALNLVMYRASEDIRTAATSLAYTVTWIMSQRLLLHLHYASLDRRNESINAAVTITQTMPSARQISNAFRSQFEPKGHDGLELTLPDFDLDTTQSHVADFPENGVEVRIERTVRLEDTSKSRTSYYELEDYSRR